MFNEYENIKITSLIEARKRVTDELRSIESVKLHEAVRIYENISNCYSFVNLKNTVCYFIQYRFFKDSDQQTGLFYAYDAICRELARRSITKEVND